MSKGNFEIKSAYSSLMNSTWDDSSSLWKHIWKMRVPQRLHIFLWVVCQHKLMKNLERCHRHIGYASLCPSCDAADESSSGANESLPWSFVFVSTLWQLWKGRNDLVFNHVRYSSDVIVHRALTWARYYSESSPQ
ncbi:hypothetical protein V6N12_020098 [Hibiscus sabdariffa]|uniref:Reverse transcriptase zinc-binding domain-containing protein n=1 Tax=Hibiscus sabdariffa TaxID=183260 RepID=A0ABR1ZEH6_9ROSI